jgi:hypothetical protein
MMSEAGDDHTCAALYNVTLLSTSSGTDVTLSASSGSAQALSKGQELMSRWVL